MLKHMELGTVFMNLYKLIDRSHGIALRYDWEKGFDFKFIYIEAQCRL
jgi:hypothetical protein